VGGFVGEGGVLMLGGGQMKGRGKELKFSNRTRQGGKFENMRRPRRVEGVNSVRFTEKVCLGITKKCGAEFL